MKIITANEIARLNKEELFADAFTYLEEDLMRWEDFKKSPRHATHFAHGVFELMPCADDVYYTYKYVNAHPANPDKNKMSIVATGMLVDNETGYPLLFCDMTILTAIRTAATSALAAKHLARADSKVLGLIGTGAQSEFQAFAMRQLFNIETIRYYDRDPVAMQKFADHQAGEGVELVACSHGEEVVQGVDILTTCICEKKHVVLFPYSAIADNAGLFINGIGGDCPGKTELDPEILKHSRIVVEFYEQTKEEGEIQNLGHKPEYNELWEVVQGVKPGREGLDGCILFDSVGFGLADFSMMRMLDECGVGADSEILPQPDNPKDLFSIFQS
ncbi:ornithine cyclodeaminase [Patescibacteria group bacterium]